MLRVPVLLLVVSVAATAAQTDRFEVASIRSQSERGLPPVIAVEASGRLVAPNVTLRDLIRAAYGLDDNQVVGGPEWMGGARFAVEARAAFPEPSDEQIRGMLAALLIERFGLITHRETRDLPVYALRPSREDGRLGSRIRPAGAECAPVSPPPGVPMPPPPPPGVANRRPLAPTSAGFRCPVLFFPGWIVGRAVTMPQLTARLTTLVDRAVVDRTGLAGEFDVDLAYTPEHPPVLNGAELPPTADGASIFTAIREQLGLTLDPQRAPVEVLVIDRAERPTEN